MKELEYYKVEHSQYNMGYRILEKNYIIRTLWTLEARIEGFFCCLFILHLCESCKSFH